MKKTIIDTDKQPKIPFDGWTVESHTGMGKLEWNPENVELHLEPEQKNRFIEGNELRKRLEGKPVLNATVLDYLLDHQELIPDSWKEKYVYFWGTIFRYASGDLCVECLCWGGSRWVWNDDWLGSDWDSGDPAASLKSMPSDPLSLEIETIKVNGRTYKLVD